MPKVTIPAAEAIKSFAKTDITVNVPELKNGKAIRDPATRRIVTKNEKLAAAHIIGASEDDGLVTIVVADGNRHQAEKAAK